LLLETPESSVKVIGFFKKNTGQTASPPQRGMAFSIQKGIL
jgi:hypothetical protein